MDFFDYGIEFGLIPYAAGTEKIIEDIVNHYRETGETSFNIDVDDSFNYDWDYIQSEVQRRI